MTVKGLRDKGYEVQVTHHRYHPVLGIPTALTYMLFPSYEIISRYESLKKVLPNGGKTVVDIYNTKDSISYTGVSECSLKDHYNKKLGVRIAIGRALKNYNV